MSHPREEQLRARCAQSRPSYSEGVRQSRKIWGTQPPPGATRRGPALSWPGSPGGGALASPVRTTESFHLIHPDDYAEWGYPHAIWKRLRREDPVHWFERTEGMPFWAITKHADIVAIG